MSDATTLVIQRQLPGDRWSQWETPKNDPVSAHEALIANGKAWPTDTFRIVSIETTEISRITNGALLVKQPSTTGE